MIVGQSYGAFTATFHGVHRLMAYDRVSGEVVGRGGLSRTPVDEDWGQIYSFLPAEPWVRVDHESHRPSSRTRTGLRSDGRRISC